MCQAPTIGARGDLQTEIFIVVCLPRQCGPNCSIRKLHLSRSSGLAAAETNIIWEQNSSVSTCVLWECVGGIGIFAFGSLIHKQESEKHILKEHPVSSVCRSHSADLPMCHIFPLYLTCPPLFIRSTYTGFTTDLPIYIYA